MSLVQFRPKRQLTVPTEVANQLELKAGDYLEAAAEGGKLVFTIKTIKDRMDGMQPPGQIEPAALVTALEALLATSPQTTDECVAWLERAQQVSDLAENAGMTDDPSWQETARKIAVASLENAPSYDTGGDDSVELLRRLRQERSDYVAARHNPVQV